MQRGHSAAGAPVPRRRDNQNSARLDAGSVCRRVFEDRTSNAELILGYSTDGKGMVAYLYSAVFAGETTK